MARDARFWRNVTIIAVVHVAVAVMFVGWSHQARKPEQPGIVWMTGGSAEGGSKRSPSLAESVVEIASPPEARLPAVTQEAHEPALTGPVKSEIQLPVTTPSPTPVKTSIPKASVTPGPKAPPKRMATPTPRSTPKKTVSAKATPAPSPKDKAKLGEQQEVKNHVEKEKAAKEKETSKAASTDPNRGDGGKSGANGSGGGIRESEFSWYGKMLHDRFYREWIQPTTSVPAGAKMSAVVRIRIERDGRISRFNIARPSGNVVVDESVAAVAKRVTQVDPLPNGLTESPYYEVNITFELNPTG